jgi:hypothetical protein
MYNLSILFRNLDRCLLHGMCHTITIPESGKSQDLQSARWDPGELMP